MGVGCKYRERGGGGANGVEYEQNLTDYRYQAYLQTSPRNRSVKNPCWKTRDKYGYESSAFLI